MQEILTGFRSSGLEELNRNDLLLCTHDKHDIVCQLIIDRVAADKHFTLPENPFGEDTCTYCNGMGCKFLFNRELSVRICLKCDKGKKTIPCTRCQNGRYIREKNGLKLNVKCKFCNGTKQRVVKCKTCRGTGELRKMVITPSIKSTTPCKHCRELGFVDEKLFAIIDDTEKYEDVADQLLECLLPQEETPIDSIESNDLT
jgi:hypothetical protein